MATSPGPGNMSPVRPLTMVGNASNLLGILVVMVSFMQQIYCSTTTIFRHRRSLLLALLIPALGIGAGCIERPSTIDPAPPRPYEGVELRLAASDPEDRALLQQLAHEWASRSGAKIRVLDDSWDGSADVGLIRTAELGRWADSGQIALAPNDLKQPANSYRWEDLLPAYSVRLTNWNDRTYALPVLGEGMVVLYRRDFFDGKGDHPATPPSDWSDFLDYTKPFGAQYLPPLPKSSERLLAEFFSAAACFDRQAVSRLAPEDLIGGSGMFFSFQFDANSGKPRLDAPAFQHVAQLFGKMMPLRCQDRDAIEAFKSGQAKVGIVSLAELAHIAPELSSQLGVAPLPGAGSVFGQDGKLRPNKQQTVNRIPYLGWGGRIGVVSAKSKVADAAWDFLIQVGMPDRTSLDLIANAHLGVGPYRTSQLEGRARPRWFGYELTAAETDHLIAALHDNIAIGVRNYRIRLRTPNQGELAAALDDELRKSFEAKRPVDMNKANQRWLEIIRKLPANEWKAVARRSLGL